MVCRIRLEGKIAAAGVVCVLVFLAFAAFSAPAVSALSEEPRELALLTWTPEKPSQGQVVHFRVRPAEGWAVTGMSFQSRPLRFFTLEDGNAEWHALCGVDAQLEPGQYEFQVQTMDQAGHPGVVGVAKLEVLPGNFAQEHLKLPASMVDLSRKNLERVRRERARVESLWPVETPELLWKGPFLTPVEGGSGSPFGVRRWINGQPRSPHTGQDISAPEGSPVRAANSGKVAFVADHFFEGKSVFLDHGGGLYTMYFHLSRICVREGDMVPRGDVLGWVGSTGRATGPHLHWGVRLGGARVDPQSLLERTGEFR